jgi:hypothetical protein
VQSYTLYLHEDAARRFAALALRDQRRLAPILDRLKTQPFLAGDYRESDAVGRHQEVLLVDRWLITFRADHAASEMSILRIESVEE